MPDPEELALDLTDPQSVATALSNIVYDACYSAQVTDTLNVQNDVETERSRWTRVMNNLNDRDLWKAIGWDGEVHNSDPGQECPTDDEFERHYNDLLNPPRDPLVLPNTGPFIPVLDSEISEPEVHTAIKNIKAAKAPGADGVPPGILKLFSSTWIRIIATVFNSVFNSGTYPREWATAKLFNVYKKGPRKDPKNYRGISILSFMAKLYDSVLTNRLCLWYKPDVEQAGVQKKRGCSEQLLVLRLLVDFARHSKQSLIITFVDFRQAYDRVPR